MRSSGDSVPRFHAIVDGASLVADGARRLPPSLKLRRTTVALAEVVRRATGARLTSSRRTESLYRLTEYFVNAPPACVNEFGPSAAYTFPSASTATPSPAVP